MRSILNNSVGYTDEKGFSLVEMLVVIAITGVIAWLTFSIYLFGQRYFINWNKKLNLQNELHVIIQGLAEDIYRAEHIVAFEENKLVLQMGDQSERVCQAQDDTLFRNKRNLLSDDLSLVAFRVAAHHKKSSGASKPTGMGRAEAGKIDLFELMLSLTNRRDTLSTTRVVHLRKPSNWNSLKRK